MVVLSHTYFKEILKLLAVTYNNNLFYAYVIISTYFKIYLFLSFYF